MRKTLRSPRALTVTVASLAVVVLTATAAWAPKYLFSPIVTGPCTADDGASGSFRLTLSPDHFEVNRDGLVAVGLVNGICDVPGREDPGITDAPLFTEVSFGNHDCDSIVLRFGDITVKDSTFDLSEVSVVLTPAEVGKKLCSIAKAIDDRTLERLAPYLTKRLL